MEYSKEDLMEAKKQILGVGENMGTEESKKIWEENAQFWDNAMGDESNEFHREVVRPKVTELLSPNPADYILDIACGNGNYSSYLAQRGASVVAFDYSKKMIELAKRRQSQYAKQIEFCVADATDRKSILELKRNRAFTKAVSNMAIMDITDIEPLFMAVYELLEENGIFVFATQHPCFITLTEKYMTPHSYYDIAIEGQPEEQIYYHRSIIKLHYCQYMFFILLQSVSKYDIYLLLHSHIHATYLNLNFIMTGALKHSRAGTEAATLQT